MIEKRARRAGIARTTSALSSITALLVMLGWSPGADADDVTPEAARDPVGLAPAFVEEIRIKGTKQSVDQAAQEAPVAVSVFGTEQLEALKVVDVEDLTFAIPNVSLDEVGTTRGVASFVIRGLGINSSIPSLDPTVGLFLDGMYLGVNLGVVLDAIDLEAIEVLRGPQGLLFGRNVTGGAVLLRTRRPDEELTGSAKVGLSGGLGLGTGLEYLGATRVSGSLVDGLLRASLSAQYRYDEGWFENQLDGEDLGQERAVIVKPVATLTPMDGLELTVIYEHGEFDGDGPTPQNRGFLDDFDVSIDEEGFTDFSWDHVISDTTLDVGLGDGRITNLFGWRQVDETGSGDIDATPELLFNGPFLFDQEQFSNELRYAGRFLDRWHLIAGAYYFTQDILYRERRVLAGGAIDSTLGGNQETEMVGLFTQSDIDLLEDLVLTLGVRYTYEEKKARIATFNPVESPCGVVDRTCTFDFVDDEDWDNVTPKVGLQWWADENVQVYGHWTKGFRSGGFNFRSTSQTIPPGPYDEEKQDSFELGVKSQLFQGRVRANLTGFYSIVDDLQREIAIPDETSAVVQIIRNTGDARIFGFELEGSALVTDAFSVRGSLGYTDGAYTDVRFDLNGDGVVDRRDENLRLPRLEEWSVAVGGTYDQHVPGVGLFTLGADYAYRDDAAFTDDNRGTLPSGNVIDASLAYRPGSVTIASLEAEPSLSIYGKNLLNESFRTQDVPLPEAIGTAPLGGTFSPLRKGRVVGAELRVDF